MIADNLRQLRSEMPEGVTLVAVSKFHPVEALREAYDAGQRIFGESRVQELLAKQPQLPDDIQWHFIGHLQTNKVRHIIGRTSLIESIDTERLLGIVDSESARAGVTTRVLMQLHVAREETKFGFSPEELLAYFRDRRFESLTNTHICGVMGMPCTPNADSAQRGRPRPARFRHCVDGHERRLEDSRQPRLEHGAHRLGHFRGKTILNSSKCCFSA